MKKFLLGSLIIFFSTTASPLAGSHPKSVPQAIPAPKATSSEHGQAPIALPAIPATQSLEQQKEQEHLNELTFKECYKQMLLIRDNPEIQDLNQALKPFLEALEEMPLLATTVDEKKELADFLWVNGFHKEQILWIKKIQKQTLRSRDQNSLLKFISWHKNGAGCIEKNTVLADFYESSLQFVLSLKHFESKPEPIADANPKYLG